MCLGVIPVVLANKRAQLQHGQHSGSPSPHHLVTLRTVLRVASIEDVCLVEQQKVVVCVRIPTLFVHICEEI